MNKNILVVVLLLVAVNCFGQVKTPVKFSFSAKKKGTGIYAVQLTALIDEGWHIYSQTTPPGGPVPTSVSFTKNPLVSLQGAVKEIGKLEQHHEPLFGVDVKQFSKKVVFEQTVQLTAAAKTNVTGSIEYMVCNDKECLPPKKEKFSISLN